MDNILGVGFFILVVANWILYHKIFRVVYFGSMQKSLLREFFGCFFVAIVEIGIVIAVGKWVLKILLIIAAIVAVLFGIKLVWKFINTIVNKNNSEQSEE